ncbi:MAG: CDP-diacylglycerol--glycerol-3-phosphate 3-phosphatidyltransferase [Proteobacteria bacterium]|nr:CDP-diacylglycerol--glycerol-3-phosphate 3-phosphatidyltransferase [Pseudomonadota bacterium]
MMNLPNLLTILRIILVPIFLFLIISNYLYLSVAVFALAGFTDLIDGIIARKMGTVTQFGKNLDPVADKLLLSSAFVVLAFKGLIPLWLAVMVVARDSIMITTVLILKRIQHNVNTTPMILGKLTTLFQVISVLVALLFQKFYGAHLLYIITAIITVLGASQYILRELRGKRA